MTRVVPAASDAVSSSLLCRVLLVRSSLGARLRPGPAGHHGAYCEDPAAAVMNRFSRRMDAVCSGWTTTLPTWRNSSASSRRRGR